MSRAIDDVKTAYLNVVGHVGPDRHVDIHGFVLGVGPEALAFGWFAQLFLHTRKYVAGHRVNDVKVHARFLSVLVAQSTVTRFSGPMRMFRSLSPHRSAPKIGVVHLKGIITGLGSSSASAAYASVPKDPSTKVETKTCRARCVGMFVPFLCQRRRNHAHASTRDARSAIHKL